MVLLRRDLGLPTLCLASLHRKCVSVKLTGLAVRVVENVPFAWEVFGNRAVTVWVSAWRSLIQALDLLLWGEGRG